MQINQVKREIPIMINTVTIAGYIGAEPTMNI